jgi:6-phosphofructokinase 1
MEYYSMDKITYQDLQVSTLGENNIPSPFVNFAKIKISPANFVDESRRVPVNILTGGEHVEPQLSFERAGIRDKIFFEPKKVKAMIVTCGGLCPGLNDVIRGLVMELHYWYGVPEVLGARYGYAGLTEESEFPPMKLTPDNVSDIHTLGGTILGSSRGFPGTDEIVDNLERLGVNILFCIGGDGTLRGAHDVAERIAERNLKISVVGIPKTIDNDVPFVYRSFGFETSVEAARHVLDGAHVESKGALNGIGLVRLMGRDAGFITCNAVLSSGDVNYCLIPEVPFNLHGENGLLNDLRKRLKSRKHAVIAVAEGAGQHLIGNSDKKDASGNKLHKDIGDFLTAEIKAAFKEWNEPVSLKYFDPSYSIRSVPANANDSIFCHSLAGFAVNAAMSGKTDLLIGYWHGEFTHVPLGAAKKSQKRVDPKQQLWRQVMRITGQSCQILK